MMIQIIFSVYDVASGTFQRPFVALKKGEAIRSFVDICADKSHPLGQHPEDYTLFELGSFNDQSGEIIDVVNAKVITGLEAADVGVSDLNGVDAMEKRNEQT